MKPLIACLAVFCLSVTAMPAVELPGGSSAKIEAAEATGFVKLVSGSGRQEYYVAIDALVGFTPKANGRGCILYIQTETAIQQTEVETSAEEILKAVKASRSVAK